MILFYHYGRAMVLKQGRVDAVLRVCVGLRSLRMCREGRRASCRHQEEGSTGGSRDMGKARGVEARSGVADVLRQEEVKRQ